MRYLSFFLMFIVVGCVMATNISFGTVSTNETDQSSGSTNQRDHLKVSDVFLSSTHSTGNRIEPAPSTTTIQDLNKNAIDAVKRKDAKILEALLSDSRLNKDLKDDDEKSLLDVAIENEDSHIIYLLLTNGADPKGKGSSKFNLTDHFQLCEAASYNLVKVMLALVEEYKIPVNNIGPRFGGSALYHAVSEGHIEAVKILLSYGANPNQPDGSGLTPLHLSGNIEIVKLLLKAGADVHVKANKADGSTPLHMIADMNVPEVVQLLIDQGADVHALDKSERTPIFLAARRGDPSIIALILAGADVNARAKQGVTPLHLSARYAQVSATKALLRAGADPTARTTTNNQSVLDWAEIEGFPEESSVKKLIQDAIISDAKNFIKIKEKRDSIDRDAVKHGNDEVLKFPIPMEKLED